jgi:hypothetical protein
MSFASGFVRYPDLFPARNAGARWGDESFSVNLPGGPYRVDGLSRSQVRAMEQRYANWKTVTDDDPAVSIEVFCAEPSDFHDPQGPSLEYVVDLDPGPSALRIAALHFMARIERREPGFAAVWTSEDEGDEFIAVIENVLRPLVAHRALSTGGMLLHSSGIVIDGRCLLFVGHSGAGKSTIAGLALDRGHKVLSDDMNCLLPGNEGWTSYVMPFAGDHQGKAERTEFPVAAIFRLEKGPENSIEPLSEASCFSLLLSSAPFVNTDPHQVDLLERTIRNLVDSLSRWHLTFKKDSSVWPIIESL